MSLSKKLLPCFCFFFAFSAVKAQYRFDQWTADTGLPQNSVYDIVQTRDGYLWLATVDGLARFDGVRFAIFNKSNSPGIVNNRFISLFEDEQDNLWAGTETGGAIRLHAGRFSSFGIGEGLTTPYIASFGSDAEGNPVAIANNYRTSRFKNGTFSLFEPPAESILPASFTPKNKIVSCQAIQSQRQFRCFVSGRWLNLIPAKDFAGLKIINTRGIEDKFGAIWLIFPEAGLIKFERDQTTTFYNEQNGLPGKPLFLVHGDERISLLSKDARGVIWLTHLGTMQSEFVTRQPPESFESFYAAYEDREGSIWVGTLRGGLFRLRKQLIRAFSKADGLSDNNVYPIFEDSRGAIWVGTTRGLFR